jgi:hypothetical protein
VETRVLEITKSSFGHLLEARPGVLDTLGVALANRLAERARLIQSGAQPPAEPDLFRRIRDFFEI